MLLLQVVLISGCLRVYTSQADAGLVRSQAQKQPTADDHADDRASRSAVSAHVRCQQPDNSADSDSQGDER